MNRPSEVIRVQVEFFSRGKICIFRQEFSKSFGRTPTRICLPFIFHPLGEVDYIIQILSYTEGYIDTSSYIDLVIRKCRESTREFNQERVDFHV